jgi:hypothetical protein
MAVTSTLLARRRTKKLRPPPCADQILMEYGTMKPLLLALRCCLSTLATAAESCGAEVKLVLAPDVQAVVTALGAGPGKSRKVYLYDTKALDLLSRGVIVRVRSGANADLMVKVRIPPEETLAGVNGLGKCEIDRNEDSAVRSYSILTPVAGELPKSGAEVLRLLSPAQQQLLKAAHISLDWSAIERLADIDSTVWQTRPQPGLGKLTLEMWQWPSGRVLELSAKTAGD